MHIPVGKKWLSRKEAALFLTDMGCPVSPKTLANLAIHNNALGGPPFSRVSYRIVMYDREDLQEWAKRQMVKVR